MMNSSGRNYGQHSGSGGLPQTPHGWLVLALCDSGRRHNTWSDSEEFRDPLPIAETGATVEAVRPKGRISALATLIGWVRRSVPQPRRAA